jgi:hypothetical protein
MWRHQNPLTQPGPVLRVWQSAEIKVAPPPRRCPDGDTGWVARDGRSDIPCRSFLWRSAPRRNLAQERNLRTPNRIEFGLPLPQKAEVETATQSSTAASAVFCSFSLTDRTKMSVRRSLSDVIGD